VRRREQNETPVNGRGQIDPAQLVFVDESGVTTEMTRRYGRALRPPVSPSRKPISLLLVPVIRNRVGMALWAELGGVFPSTPDSPIHLIAR
jgi:hypothetical protein